MRVAGKFEVFSDSFFDDDPSVAGGPLVTFDAAWEVSCRADIRLLLLALGGSCDNQGFSIVDRGFGHRKTPAVLFHACRSAAFVYHPC